MELAGFIWILRTSIDIDDILIIFRLFWKSSDGASIFFIHWRWKSKKEYSDSLINSIIKHYPIIYFRVLFNWEGVVLGFSISLWIGALWFLYNFRYQNEQSKFKLTFFDCLIFLISTFFALYSWFFPIDPSGGRVEFYFLNFLFPIILLFITLSHPINKTIMSNLFNIFKFEKKFD